MTRNTNPLDARWRLAATQGETIRKAGMQEGRNKIDTPGGSSHLLLSCLPAFLNSFPGKHASIMSVPGGHEDGSAGRTAIRAYPRLHLPFNRTEQSSGFFLCFLCLLLLNIFVLNPRFFCVQSVALFESSFSSAAAPEVADVQNHFDVAKVEGRGRRLEARRRRRAAHPATR